MKARQQNGNITTYKILPNFWNGSSGHIINFRNASTEVLEAEGFYDVVIAPYNPLTQKRSGIAWDETKKIFTGTVTDIDFDAEHDVLDENMTPTGEKEKTYKIADIKANKIAEIKSKAGKMLEPTDWQVIRKTERDIAISSDVVTERAKILTEADRIETEVNTKSDYKDLLEYKVIFFPLEEKE
jgi:hypothetical protein